MKTFFGGILGLALTVPFVASACLNEGFDGGYGMMGSGNGFWFFGIMIHILLVVIGVLTAVWLWQQVTKQK